MTLLARRHFPHVSQKSEARHVRRSFDAKLAHRFGCVLAGVNIVSTEPATIESEARPFLIPVEITPVPIGLVRMITSPGRAPELVAIFVWIDYTRNRVTKHDLLVIDAVTANQCDAILIYRLQPAAHDLTQNRGIDAFLGKTRDRHRCDRRSSHGPNVVNGVERGDAAIVVRVIDDRSEEIERLHECEVVSKAVYTRVVGCIKTDNQIWIAGLFR